MLPVLNKAWRRCSMRSIRMHLYWVPAARQRGLHFPKEQLIFPREMAIGHNIGACRIHDCKIESSLDGMIRTINNAYLARGSRNKHSAGGSRREINRYTTIAERRIKFIDGYIVTDTYFDTGW